MGSNNDNFTGHIPNELKEITVNGNSVDQYEEGMFVLLKSKKIELNRNSDETDRTRYYVGQITKIIDAGPLEKTYIVKCRVYSSKAILEFHAHYVDIIKRISNIDIRRDYEEDIIHVRNLQVFNYYNYKDLIIGPKYELDEWLYVKYTDNTKYLVLDNNFIDPITNKIIYLVAPENNRAKYLFVSEDDLFYYNTNEDDEPDYSSPSIKCDNTISHTEESKYKVGDIVDVSDKDIFAKITKIKVTNIIEIDGEIYYKFEPISCNIDFCKLSE